MFNVNRTIVGRKHPIRRSLKPSAPMIPNSLPQVPFPNRKLREDLTRVVLVDNSAKSFWLQPENGLLVCDWDGTNASDQDRSHWEGKFFLEGLHVCVGVTSSY